MSASESKDPNRRKVLQLAAKAAFIGVISPLASSPVEVIKADSSVISPLDIDFQEGLKFGAALRRLEDMRSIVREFMHPDYQGAIGGDIRNLTDDAIADLMMFQFGNPKLYESTWYIGPHHATKISYIVTNVYSEYGTEDPKKARLSRTSITVTNYISTIEGEEMFEGLKGVVNSVFNLEDKGLDYLKTTASHPEYLKRKQRELAIRAVGEYPMNSGRWIDVTATNGGFLTLVAQEEFYRDPSIQPKG